MSVRAASDKKVIGWREWVRLGSLSLPAVKAKIDTGAKTSALHVFQLDLFVRGGQRWVRLGLHPLQRNDQLVSTCEAPVLDRRFVSDSGGHRQLRYVIESEITLGNDSWPIELTLTCRDTMTFRLLLGRTALHDRFVVDPSLSYVLGKRPQSLRALLKRHAANASHLQRDTHP